MVQSKWFESDDTIYPKVITRNGVSVAIRGKYELNVYGDITVPKNKIFGDYMYEAVRVFANDTKSAMLREANAKAEKYKNDYELIRIVPYKVKGVDLVVMYAVEKQKKVSSKKYIISKVISNSKYGRL